MSATAWTQNTETARLRRPTARTVALWGGAIAGSLALYSGLIVVALMWSSILEF